MSNSIALYVGNTNDISKQIKQYHDENFDAITFENLLMDPFDSDYWAVDLMTLLDDNGATLAADVKQFVSILAGYETDSSQNDTLGLNFILSANDIISKYPETLQSTGDDIANVLYSENEFWSTKEELSQFFDVWINALKTAVKNKSGVAWVVFV